MTESKSDEGRKAGRPAGKALARRIKQHVGGKEHRFFAIVQPGFEETARGELASLGIRSFAAPVEGGVEFDAKLDGCYRVNLASRTVTRVLMRLTSFKSAEFPRLGRKVEEFPWELHLDGATPVVFKVTSRKSRLHHLGRIEEEFRRAIGARLLRHGITMPDAPESAESTDGPPAQEIFVRVFDDRFSLSLDTSGDLLYRRGRKPHAVTASLRETLAALILCEAGWPDYDVLFDPMCGAGTFALEAGEMATGRLANVDREFPFQRWPAFRAPAWRHLVSRMSEEAGSTVGAGRMLFSSDIDPAAVGATKRNLAGAGLFEALGEEAVRVSRADFLDPAVAPDIPDGGRTLVVMNPPYGKRLQGRATERLYRTIGDFLRTHPRCGFAVIVPGLELEKVLSVGHDKKIIFMNGGLRVAVLIRRAAREDGPA